MASKQEAFTDELAWAKEKSKEYAFKRQRNIMASWRNSYQEDPPEFISIIKEDNTRANKSTIPSTSMEFNEPTILDPPDTPAERTIAGKYSSQNQQQKNDRSTRTSIPSHSQG